MWRPFQRTNSRSISPKSPPLNQEADKSPQSIAWVTRGANRRQNRTGANATKDLFRLETSKNSPRRLQALSFVMKIRLKPGIFESDAFRSPVPGEAKRFQMSEAWHQREKQS